MAFRRPMYRFLRPFLFCLPPETAHHLALIGLRAADRLKLSPWFFSKPPAQPVRVMGLDFPNPIGLAAGFDKDGVCVDALAQLGFGFLEIGTVTPYAQPGNPSPRLFRLKSARALVNRMGFNNAGVSALVDQVRRSRYTGILGVNIGKNAATPFDRAIKDYLIALEAVYPVASYVALNISSPNTAGLRQLQSQQALDSLLTALKQRQQRLTDQHARYVPLALKISPDLEDQALATMAAQLQRHRIDAVIATNTTVLREGLQTKAQGGLSGVPLRRRATHVVRKLAKHLQGAVPIIGVGGVLSAADVEEKFEAGASLVQLYSGLIYEGPSLVTEAVQAYQAYQARAAV